MSMTRHMHFLVNGCLMMGILMWVSGCDGLVAVSGWVVPGQGPRSEFRASDTEPAEPREVIQQAKVELWTGDGRDKLHHWEYPHSNYTVTHIGPYCPRMEYLLKASAPGYAPLKQKVVLKKGQVVFGNIILAPLAGQDAAASRPASDPE